jgi:uncharacterized protein YkwD
MAKTAGMQPCRSRALRVLAAGAGAGALWLAPAPALADELGCEPAQPGWGTPRLDLALDVLGRLNQFRADGGLAPLAQSRALTRAALWKAGHMSALGYFDHADPPTGRSPSERAVACGYPSANVGENIARGHATPAAVMAGWAASPGHRANMLDPDHRAVGVGAVSGPGGMQWVQVFGDRPPAEPGMGPSAPSPDDLPLLEDQAPVTVDLLANDAIDPVGPARITGVGQSDLAIVEPDGDGRSIRVTPDPERSGTALLSYSVTDLLGTSVATSVLIRIAPVNDGPRANRLHEIMRPRQRRVAVPIARLGSDIDGDRLRARITRRPPRRAARVSITGRRLVVRLAPRTRRTVVRFAVIDPSGARAGGVLRLTRPPGPAGARRGAPAGR